MANINNYHQTLMDEVYGKWQELSKNGVKTDRLTVVDDFFTSKHKAAVQLGNMNYQVCNGGWSQWRFNGYDEDLDDLMDYAKAGVKYGLNTFPALYEILSAIEGLGRPEDYSYTEEVRCDECGGDGYINEYDDEKDEEIQKTCSYCSGSGYIEEDIDGEDDYCERLGEFDAKYYVIDEDELLKDFNCFLENFDEVTKLDISDVKCSSIKPVCKLVGTDGNVFSIIGNVKSALRKAGLLEKATEFQSKALKCESYDKVLQLCFDYVDVR